MNVASTTSAPCVAPVQAHSSESTGLDVLRDLIELPEVQRAVGAALKRLVSALSARGASVLVAHGDRLEVKLTVGDVPAAIPDRRQTVSGRSADITRDGRRVRLIPLVTGNEVLGAVELFDPNELDEQRLVGLGPLVDTLLALGLSAARHDRDRLEQAMRDPLTDPHRRQYFSEGVDAELQRNRRGGSAFSVAYIDIDHFKAINDELGHHTGDDVLISVARVLSRATRTEDVVARIGGEEFAVLMRGTDGAEASLVVDRLRKQVMHESILEDRSITVSVGIAVYPIDGATRETLERRADEALYWVKRNGRNSSVTASEISGLDHTETARVRSALLDDFIRERIGEPLPLDEASLAARLRVDRMAVREALTQLEVEGFVVYERAHGFAMKALTEAELLEVNPLVASLEGVALDWCMHDDRTLSRLDAINEKLAQPDLDLCHRLELDVRWHQLLLSGCGNSALLGLIARQKCALHPYYYRYMRSAPSVGRSTNQHARSSLRCDAATARRRGRPSKRTGRPRCRSSREPSYAAAPPSRRHGRPPQEATDWRVPSARLVGVPIRLRAWPRNAVNAGESHLSLCQTI